MAKPDTPSPPPLHQFPEQKIIPYDQFLTDVYKKRMRYAEVRQVMEELPDHEYWKKADQVKNSIKKFQDLALEVLRKPEVESADLNLVKDTIKKSGTIQSLGSLLAVVVGGQGIARDTLVNRLFQVPEEVTSAGWSSTTLADLPITLKGRQDVVNTVPLFSARVHLLSPKDIQEICERHVKNIAAYQARNDYHNRGKKEEAREWAEQLLLAHDLGKRKYNFKSTLNNLVGTKAVTKDVHIFETTCAAWASERIMTIIKDKDILKESTSSSPVIHFQAMSWKELEKSLGPFVKDRHVSGRDQVLTESIEISLDANVLSTGLKLVDLPGIETRNTHEYISRSHIRLVCTHEKISQFNGPITESIKKVGVQNTYVVVMCIRLSMARDNAEEAINMDAAHPFPEIKRQIKRTRVMIKRLTEGKKSEDEISEDEKSEDEKSEEESNISSSDEYTLSELINSDDCTQLELISLSAYISYLQREAKVAYAKMKCSEFQKELWAKYYDYHARDSVRIYFTSATEYRSSTNKCLDAENSFVDLGESGILRLRHDLLLQTRDRSLRALQQYVKTSMIPCYQLCVGFCAGQRYSDAQHNAIRTELAKYLLEMRSIINELGKTLGIAEVLLPDDSIQPPAIGEWDDSWLAWTRTEKGH